MLRPWGSSPVLDRVLGSFVSANALPVTCATHTLHLRSMRILRSVCQGTGVRWEFFLPIQVASSADVRSAKHVMSFPTGSVTTYLVLPISVQAVPFQQSFWGEK